jgi:hypothetical protein
MGRAGGPIARLLCRMKNFQGNFMNSMTNVSRLLAAAVCGVVLAGCNAVEDVRSNPSTPLPTQLVVLEGTVYGLGIRRSIVVRNGTGANAAQRLVQGFPGEPVGSRGRESQFSFGALVDGTAYNLVVPPDLVPYGKRCVVNNGSGTLRYDSTAAAQGAPQNIEVVCSDDPAVARYDIRVATPAAFRDAPGATVRLMTEEGIYDADPKSTADGDPEYVWFRDALITVPASGVLPFQNIVTATTETGSTATLKLVNRCAVSNHTRPSPAASVGADVTDISVGACAFAVGGSTAGTTETGGAVRYSRPVGVTVDPAMGTGGLRLELQYANGTPIPSTGGPTTEVTVSAFGSDFSFPTLVTSGSECPAPELGVDPIPCQVRGFYKVVVKQQPLNQKCIVTASTVGSTSPLLGLNDLSTPVTVTNNANTNYAAAANLYILDESIGKGTFLVSPRDFTGLRVYCRNLPVPGRILRGTYQLKNITTLTADVLTGAFPWSPAYAGRREFSHMLTLFDDGTFLFGAHTTGDAFNSTSVANHVEYGFYDFNADTIVDANNRVAGAKLRFTIHVDANTGVATGPLAAGLSAAEGPRNVGTGQAAVRHQVLTGVTLGTVAGTTRRTLTGTFGPDASTATTATRVMEFEEPASVAGQMTGTWIAQDKMGFWAFNADTTWGYHAGVENGYANIQNNCFKMDDYTVSSGVYVVTSGANLTYCAPVGQVFNSLQGSVAHSPVPLLQTRLPGWNGWMPGSELGGGSTTRSPSPVHFVIAPASGFAAAADPTIFPAGSIGPTTWCATEILGVRSTENGALTSELQPVYFCRNTI